MMKRSSLQSNFYHSFTVTFAGIRKAITALAKVIRLSDVRVHETLADQSIIGKRISHVKATAVRPTNKSVYLKLLHMKSDLMFQRD